MTLLSAVQRLGRSTLPDLSNAVRMTKLRYIQHTCEEPGFQNPDYLAGEFLSRPLRILSDAQGRLQLDRLRAFPYYHYLIARTIHYDRIFEDGFRRADRIINIGSGGCTRSHRLVDMHSGILECDQPALITRKRQIAMRKFYATHVTYAAFDFNDEATWATIEDWIAYAPQPVTVIMEGVSAYIPRMQFRRFMRFLASWLPPASRIAYDFKFLSPSDRPKAFSLTAREIETFHQIARIGRVTDLQFSDELTKRELPPGRTIAPFKEDALVTIE